MLCSMVIVKTILHSKRVKALDDPNNVLDVHDDQNDSHSEIGKISKDDTRLDVRSIVPTQLPTIATSQLTKHI